MDVFITSQAYVDIASISVIAKNTGGKVLKSVFFYFYTQVLVDQFQPFCFLGK